MIHSLKNILKKLFRKELIAEPAFNLITAGTHPLDIEYSGFEGSVIDIPVNRCRSYLLGYLPQEHPFCKTLKQYNTQPHTFENSNLSKYYETFKPKTMADVLKIKSKKLEEYPAMATIMPWSYSNPEQRIARFCIEGRDSKLLSREGYKHGLDPVDNFGCQFFGPISNDHGELEFNRLISVNNDIIKEGYAPSQHGHLHGEFLIDGADWVWIAIGGKHRFSVLSALDFDTIPVARRARWAALFVRRSEVAHWPNVRNGLFSVEEALSVFDRIMKGSKISDYIT